MQGIDIQTRRLSVEHITVAGPAPYEEVKNRLEARLGRLHDGIRKLLAENDIAGVRKALEEAAGKDGLAIHYVGVHGDWLALEGQRRNATAYLIGNVLYAVQMTKVNLAAGLYAPLRVVLYGSEAGGSVFEYDKPSSLFGQFDEPEIDAVARILDAKLLALLSDVLQPA